MAGNGLSERLQTPISTAELERRWAAVRAAMKREGVDVLLMQNNNDHMGGYVKYFTDMPATNGYPQTVIFRPTMRCPWCSRDRSAVIAGPRRTSGAG